MTEEQKLLLEAGLGECYNHPPTMWDVDDVVRSLRIYTDDGTTALPDGYNFYIANMRPGGNGTYVLDSMDLDWWKASDRDMTDRIKEVLPILLKQLTRPNVQGSWA